MLDHIFITVTDLDRSIDFYEQALAPFGIRHAIDYDGANGPEGHPDLKAFYLAAIAAGGTDNGPPSARMHYDPSYYAANILDPAGYSIEVVYKSWQHPQP